MLKINYVNWIVLVKKGYTKGDWKLGRTPCTCHCSSQHLGIAGKLHLTSSDHVLRSARGRWSLMAWAPWGDLHRVVLQAERPLSWLSPYHLVKQCLVCLSSHSVENPRAYVEVSGELRSWGPCQPEWLGKIESHFSPLLPSWIIVCAIFAFSQGIKTTRKHI